MKIRSLIPWLLGAVASLSQFHAAAQSVYRAGDLVENFTLVNRRTGQPMQLTDLAGKIVFIDFFAHWCPVCAAAAPQLEAGVYERYRETGNAMGVPVVYVLCNLQGDFSPRDISGTDAFVSRFGDDVVVLQDPSRALQRRFTSSGGQPTFAVINGVANSPSHRQWELVYSVHGYFSPGRVQPVEDFQAAIDRVQPPPAIAPPRITTQPQSQRVFAGDQAVFSVAATGDGPLTYQWTRNGELIPNADQATLALSNVQEDQAGSFRVRVTNPGGAVESEPANLIVEKRAEVPIRLAPGRVTASGAFEFSFTGTPGRSHRVEVSSDLAAWSVLTRIVAGPSANPFQDPEALSQGWRFYRIVAE